MKTFTVAAAVALLAATANAVPTEGHKGGWKGMDHYRCQNDKDATKCPDSIFKFTSTYHVTATPDQVRNGTTPTGGLAGAVGYYDFGINSDVDLICWNITLVNFRGEYVSPARTATHIHEAARGASGPPRLVFPNPAGNGTVRNSYGCMTGPFTTGVKINGTDPGTGFKVAQIEANPAAFFCDAHSSLAVPGAVRGQLA
ncbi:hypothetical protein B0A49_10083 [Cryomyces minteri]|uniref:CHRD domain-containing protein n=1 Tax=Cryomyces minteri TaxID=331657 RepID=A0A4V5NDS6_9PEZI|nr:hypothetical protein B0A49_10083 [Cryomyces minteri]